MNEKRRMNIATAFNSKYARYAYVMLTSLLENQLPETEVNVYILYSEVTEENRNCIEQLTESYGGSVHWIFVSNEVFPDNCPTSIFWTLEAYYRLLLSDLLPEDVDRILYLDVDIIVNQSLEEIYNTDFECKLLCACKDIYPLDSDKGSFFGDKRDILFREQLKQDFTYFNSGVILFDMNRMRKEYCLKQYLELGDKLKFDVIAPDQDLLNYMHWQDVKLIDGNQYDLFAKVAYNHGIHYEEVKKEVTIIHFAGQKPWIGYYVHFDIEQLWWDYAKMSPFYNELLEEFMQQSLHNPLIYDTLLQCSLEKQQLQEELDKSVKLCQRLVKMIEEKTEQ